MSSNTQAKFRDRPSMLACTAACRREHTPLLKHMHGFTESSGSSCMCMLELELEELRMLAYPCHAHSPLIEAIGMDTKLELV